ncbi:MAG: hypothetical protein CL483_10135 [Acidobacteria bacterium]|nr:hypothetical protein [Acidobacteriota bacterium]
MIAIRRKKVDTSRQDDVHDFTKVVGRIVVGSGCWFGLATVSIVGSTVALTTIEYEPGAVADFNGLFETLAPPDVHDAYHERWSDDNGSSHVRAALVGPSLSCRSKTFSSCWVRGKRSSASNVTLDFASSHWAHR